MELATNRLTLLKRLEHTQNRGSVRRIRSGGLIVAFQLHGTSTEKGFNSGRSRQEFVGALTQGKIAWNFFGRRLQAECLVHHVAESGVVRGGHASNIADGCPPGIDPSSKADGSVQPKLRLQACRDCYQP